MDTLYYTPQEVAEQLKLRVHTVYAYIRQGRLPAVQFGNRCRIARADLEAFVAGRHGRAGSASRRERPAASSLFTFDRPRACRRRGG